MLNLDQLSTFFKALVAAVPTASSTFGRRVWENIAPPKWSNQEPALIFSAQIAPKPNSRQLDVTWTVKVYGGTAHNAQAQEIAQDIFDAFHSRNTSVATPRVQVLRADFISITPTIEPETGYPVCLLLFSTWVD
jgi:hypothetical protein